MWKRIKKRRFKAFFVIFIVKLDKTLWTSVDFSVVIMPLWTSVGRKNLAITFSRSLCYHLQSTLAHKQKEGAGKGKGYQKSSQDIRPQMLHSQPLTFYIHPNYNRNATNKKINGQRTRHWAGHAALHKSNGRKRHIGSKQMLNIKLNQFLTGLKPQSRKSLSSKLKLFFL